MRLIARICSKAYTSQLFFATAQIITRCNLCAKHGMWANSCPSSIAFRMFAPESVVANMGVKDSTSLGPPTTASISHSAQSSRTYCSKTPAVWGISGCRLKSNFYALISQPSSHSTTDLPVKDWNCPANFEAHPSVVMET